MPSAASSSSSSHPSLPPYWAFSFSLRRRVFWWCSSSSGSETLLEVEMDGNLVDKGEMSMGLLYGEDVVAFEVCDRRR